MEIWKQRVWTLEKKVADLTERLDASEKLPETVHYAAFDKEMGQHSLEELDNFRFIIRESGGNPTHKYSYELRNPTAELQELIKTTFPQNYFQTGPIYIRSSNPPEEVEGEVLDVISSHNQGEHHIPLKKEIKQILHSKPWAFSKTRDFVQKVTIEFKNTYKLLPHVTFFQAPLTGTNVHVSLINLTCKNMTLELKYGTADDGGGVRYTHNDVPPTAVLHWLVQGAVETKDVISELLDA
jgi:hypothetical protein